MREPRSFSDGVDRLLDDIRPHGRAESVDIDRLKRVLRKRKDELFDLHLDESDRVILEYPAAR